MPPKQASGPTVIVHCDESGPGGFVLPAQEVHRIANVFDNGGVCHA